MEMVYYILSFFGEHKEVIYTSMFWFLLIFSYWVVYYIFPKIEKNLNEKEETILGARGHYKNLLIENKILKNGVEELKKEIIAIKNIEQEKVYKRKYHDSRMQKLERKQ